MHYIQLFKDLCLLQTFGYQAENHRKKAQENKTFNQIIRKSHLIMKQKANQDRQLSVQAKKIKNMVETIYGKAGDIMCGRNSSNYNRKQQNKGEISLKQLKSYTSEKSLKKIQATRHTMLNKVQNLEEKNTISVENSNIKDSLSLQYSRNQSLLSNSVLSNEAFKQTTKAKKQKEGILKNILKAQGFDQVYQAQRRNAANTGFGMFWDMGKVDKVINKASIFEKGKWYKKSTKKKEDVKYKKSFVQELNDNNSCQMEVKHKYLNAFQERSRQFGLAKQS